MSKLVGMEVVSKPSVNELTHHGVKGMHWGVRKSPQQQRYEQKTGQQYRRSTFNATKRAPEGPIKKKYTKEEILTARRIQAGRREAIKALDSKYGKDPQTKKFIFTKEHEKVYGQLLNSRERVIAQHKTTGEKVVATLLMGPIGTYKTADFNVMNRVANKRA